METKECQLCHHNHSESHTSSCVSLVPIFNHLENEQLAEVMEMVYSATYKKGEFLYHAGDSAETLYIVSKGKIRIYRISESGKEQLVRILTPGSYTGELALFKDTVHEAFAQTMEDSQVCMIKRSDLQTLLYKFPAISLKILTEFSNRLDESEKQTTRFATESVETRIALFLAECMTDPLSNEIILPMSKKDLASYLGTTPETISRKFAQFEEQGFIKQKSNKKIEIIDIDGLLLM